MADMIPKDRAIAALSEINKLRHDLNEEILRKERLYSDRLGRATDMYFCDGLKSAYQRLTESLERAYEILNNG